MSRLTNSRNLGQAIVHVGLGNFVRAHLASYMQTYHEVRDMVQGHRAPLVGGFTEVDWPPRVISRVEQQVKTTSKKNRRGPKFNFSIRYGWRDGGGVGSTTLFLDFRCKMCKFAYHL